MQSSWGSNPGSIDFDGQRTPLLGNQVPTTSYTEQQSSNIWIGKKARQNVTSHTSNYKTINTSVLWVSFIQIEHGSLGSMAASHCPYCVRILLNLYQYQMKVYRNANFVSRKPMYPRWNNEAFIHILLSKSSK